MERSPNQPERVSHPWRSGAVWSGLLLIGLLIYELTSEPWLGAAVSCTKFGWQDFRSAFWLRRVDPDRTRGRICFWFYLAHGLGKVALWSLVLTFALTFLLSLFINAGPQGLGVRLSFFSLMLGALLAAGVGFALSSVTTLLATYFAFRRGVKVWVGSAPHWARRQRYWPPRYGTLNEAELVAWVVMLTLVPPTSIVVVVALGQILPNDPFLWFVLTACVFFLPLIVTAIFFGVVVPLVFAATPLECWPLLPAEDVFEAPTADLP
jgi:hypothetical protein